MNHGTSLPFQIGILLFLIAALLAIHRFAPPAPRPAPPAPESQVSATAAVQESVATSSVPNEEPEERAVSQTAETSTEKESEESIAPAEPANPNQVKRIEQPYPSPQLSFETVNIAARAALVNIFCSSRTSAFRPISGSGVFIDPKGIILTNAHVAQYVLLAESRRTNLECQLRTGSPATARWVPLVLYVPPVWVEKHAPDITNERPVGTGEHDFALLYAGASLDGMPRPSAFPYLRPDTREAIGFVDDPVLAASYPAEFLGAITSTFSLYPVTSITTIDDLYTFDRHTVDALSIGSVIGAQSGSSGGAIANAWARLIGLITTTSEGGTTGERTLRGISLSYIDRDLAAQSGVNLAGMLSDDPAARAAEFWTDTAPSLVEQLLAPLR